MARIRYTLQCKTGPVKNEVCGHAGKCCDKRRLLLFVMLQCTSNNWNNMTYFQFLIIELIHISVISIITTMYWDIKDGKCRTLATQANLKWWYWKWHLRTFHLKGIFSSQINQIAGNFLTLSMLESRITIFFLTYLPHYKNK
jgi:hypothetical protein